MKWKWKVIHINGYNIMNWCERDGKETRTLKCTSVNMDKGSVGSWAARCRQKMRNWKEK